LTRALVIGGGGFIGVAACKELMRRGIETVAAGRKDRPYGTFTSYVAFDRDDEAQLRRAIQSVTPDVILDLACFQPAQMRMMIGAFAGERYVFVSTSGVYPDLHGRTAREEDFAPLAGSPPDGPLDYQDGKRWCETLVMRTFDLPWTILRPPAVFGPGDHTLRIAAYMQRVADGGPVLVPQETYEKPAGLAWVKDVGYACALACDPRKKIDARVYNVGFENVSLRDLIGGIAEAMGVPAKIRPIPFAELPDGASPYGPPPWRQAGVDIARAKSDLGFEPSALGDALVETLAWFRVARPSHPGYANRQTELTVAGTS
jgi:nucleoside-diphosphate-sugar epimerase